MPAKPKLKRMIASTVHHFEDHIYQLHLVNNVKEMEERRDVVNFLLEFKQQKLIRAIGASVHRVEGAKAVAVEKDIDILFPVLNSHGLGIMAMKPLGGGHLRKSPRESFDFLRGLGFVDTICVSMKTPAEVDMNVRTIEGWPVPQETLTRIETTPRKLKIYDRCQDCGSCVEECAQGALSLDISKADPAKGKRGMAIVDNQLCILCGYCAEACPELALCVI